MKMKKMLSSFLAAAMVMSTMGISAYAEETVAKILDEEYGSIKDAVEAAQSGDEVIIVSDASDEAVQVDESITISGDVNLTDVSFDAVSGCEELVVSGLSFEGNSWINSGAADKLTVTGVKAYVNPSNKNQTNSRAAFISLGRSEQKILDLVIKDCNIVSLGGSNPVLGWAAINTAEITGNTFGSDSEHQWNSDSVKFMSIAKDAVLTFTGNTVYSDYNGIVLGQNTTRGNAYTAIFENNTFIGGADHIWIEVSGSSVCHGKFRMSSDNTVNGNTATVNDFKIHPNLKTFTGYMGVDVIFDENDKIIGGTFISTANLEDYLAEGYGYNSQTGEVKGYAAGIVGGKMYNTYSEALSAAVDGDVIEIYTSGEYDFVPFGKDITIKAVNGADVSFVNINQPALSGADVTFENITFEYASNSSYKGLQHSGDLVYNNCTFNGQIFLYGQSETFNNCTFNQESADGYNVWTYSAKAVEFNGCTFNSNGRSVLVYNEGGNGTALNVTNTAFNAENPADGKAAIEIDSSALKNGLVHTVNVDDATTAVGFGTGNVSGNSLWNNKKGVKTIVIVNGEVALAAAKIGNTAYASIEEAFEAAGSDDTIVLCSNVAPVLTSQKAITDAKVIDLNGYVLTLNEDDLYFGEMTFKNGTINVGAVNASTAIFWQFALQNLTFDNVVLNANDVTGTYLIGFEGVSALNIVNGSVINVKPENPAGTLSAVVAHNGNGNVNIVDSTINNANTGKHTFLYGKITVKGNSTIISENVSSGVYLSNEGYLDVQDNAYVKITQKADSKYNAGINLAENSAYLVADTATVISTVYKVPTASNLAKEVKLTFEATDSRNIYNIYVEAVDGTLNRLSAVQAKFNLDNANMSYTLAPADGVTLTNDIDTPDAYVFNFDGVNAPDATGVKILIGSVEFEDYGTFNFTIDGSYEAKVKTALVEDNIVAEYVPNPDAANAKQGKFDIDTSVITGGSIERAMRAVNVEINFNNNITAGRDHDMLDMTVTVSGGPDNDVFEKKVADVAYTAEKAVVPFEVVAGYRYTVVVKGAGYRTARYSTVVDEADTALTLKFWNNALENADRTIKTAYIEDGVARSLTDKTFLAGDIAPDNIIDKYDLAAVVSYFGYEDIPANYVKYDLNRDGQIDADDIAYVLVSWDK